MALSHLSEYQEPREEDGSGNMGKTISQQLSPKYLAWEGKWLSTQ